MSKSDSSNESWIITASRRVTQLSWPQLGRLPAKSPPLPPGEKFVSAMSISKPVFVEKIYNDIPGKISEEGLPCLAVVSAQHGGCVPAIFAADYLGVKFAEHLFGIKFWTQRAAVKWYNLRHRGEISLRDLLAWHAYRGPKTGFVKKLMPESFFARWRTLKAELWAEIGFDAAEPSGKLNKECASMDVRARFPIIRPLIFAFVEDFISFLSAEKNSEKLLSALMVAPDKFVFAAAEALPFGCFLKFKGQPENGHLWASVAALLMQKNFSDSAASYICSNWFGCEYRDFVESAAKARPEKFFKAVASGINVFNVFDEEIESRSDAFQAASSG